MVATLVVAVELASLPEVVTVLLLVVAEVAPGSEDVALVLTLVILDASELVEAVVVAVAPLVETIDEEAPLSVEDISCDVLVEVAP